MLKLATVLLKSAWSLGMLACLVVGAQAIQDRPPQVQPENPSSEPAFDETARLLKENQRLKLQLVDAAAQANIQRAQDNQSGDSPAKPFIYDHGRLVPVSSASIRTYTSSKPRPKWRYREPTCTPSRTQIAWARMLPNYEGLVSRGLSDEDIIHYFAPSEVKALEGDEIPLHLRPDLHPAVVFINQRCADGTCTTGYCEASRRNLGCKDGRCEVLRP